MKTIVYKTSIHKRETCVCSPHLSFQDFSNFFLKIKEQKFTIKFWHKLKIEFSCRENLIYAFKPC